MPSKWMGKEVGKTEKGLHIGKEWEENGGQ